MSQPAPAPAHGSLDAPNDLAAAWNALTTEQRQRFQRVLRQAPVSRDVDAELLERRTVGERVADRVAAFGGSWTFIGLFAGVLIAWITLNSVLLARHAFDPYPYILLNLLLSMIAALQAPVIMMSQNRQTARDRLNAANDYEVNLKAEVEIRALHDKLDALREAQWSELVRLQQEQLRLLTALLERR